MSIGMAWKMGVGMVWKRGVGMAWKRGGRNGMENGVGSVSEIKY